MEASSTRRFERFPVDQIEGRLRLPGDVKILDLSETGMRLATRSRLAAGEHRTLRLSYRGQEVVLAVRVRWVRPEGPAGSGGSDADPTLHQVGVSFLEVVSKAPTGLWDWILPEDVVQL